MAVFWSRDDATVRQVLEALNEGRKPRLAYTTVLTLVGRLWERGFLERQPEGRGFRYRATRTREELLGELSDELIDRLLDDFGEIAVARLGERLQSLDPAKLEQLGVVRRKQ